jgi:hypothetical protein
MNKQGNEKRLDELISRTINTEKPQFDAEKWKQKYPAEFQSLLSRAAKGDSARQPSILKVIFKSPLTKLATAAVIIIAISFFTARQGPTKKADTTTVSKATKSPVEMMTALSLERAFRRGGIKAVENQCEQALKLLGPRTASLSSKELLSEFNGS